MIVLMAGLPGTGKTTLARALARRTQGALLSKDEIRAALFSPQDLEYSVQQDDFVMEGMLEAARFLLPQKPPRRALANATVPVKSARRRLDLEPDPSHPAHNRTFALYLEVKARFEPIAYPKTTISTDQPLERCIEQALAALNAS